MRFSLTRHKLTRTTTVINLLVACLLQVILTIRAQVFFLFVFFFLINDAFLITYTKKKEKEKKFGYSTATRQIDYLQRVYYIYIYLHQ